MQVGEVEVLFQLQDREDKPSLVETVEFDRHLIDPLPLPHLPGGDGAQFWWVLGMMLGLSAAMLGYFRASRWI